MSELLLEIRTESLPAEHSNRLARQIQKGLSRALAEHGFASTANDVGSTLRRLVIVLSGLAATGEASADAGDDRATRLEEVLRDCIGETLLRVRLARAVRWRSDVAPFSRPVVGVVALLDGDVLPIEVFGVEASNESTGHPGLSAEPFEVSSAGDHARQLASRGIEIRPEIRRRIVEEKLESTADSLGGRLVADVALLERLADACEIPGVLEVPLPEASLFLPRALVLHVLGERHGALGVAAGDGSLLPWFLIGMDRPDDPTGCVRAGHEWAARRHLHELARLWSGDREVPLAERYRSLVGREWEDGPGDLFDRAERMASLCEALSESLGWREQADRAAEAARLLEADHSCLLVKTYPRLAGTVGSLLAREEGYPESVSSALRDHGQSVAAGRLYPPRGRVSRVVAIGCRLDAMVGRVGISESSPSRSAQSPLRVGVREILEIVLGDGDAKDAAQSGESVPLDLDLALAQAVRAYRGELRRSEHEVVEHLRQVFETGLRADLEARGFFVDEVEAVLSSSGSRRLPEMLARLRTIHSVRGEPGFDKLVRTARRLVDVLHESPESDVNEGLLTEPSERDLLLISREQRAPVERALEDPTGGRAWLDGMLTVSEAVDAFLVSVLVRDDNDLLRENRLALLQTVHRMFSRRVRLAVLGDGGE